MERKLEMQHVTVDVDADFERFTQRLEKSLERFDNSILTDAAGNPQAAVERLKKAAGKEELMLFSIREHGQLLRMHGISGKAKQYEIGNALIALKMTRHDVRAALYAPLRVLVYEMDDKSTRIEFDQPSSLFGQFDNPEVTAVGRLLDEKLMNLIQKVGQSAKEARAGDS